MTGLDDIRKILDIHEKRISDLEKSIRSKSIMTSISGEDIVMNLINSGFFIHPKKYGDMIKELKLQAKFNKNHNYKEILIQLTRKDKLKRKMTGHQWWYSKK